LSLLPQEGWTKALESAAPTFQRLAFATQVHLMESRDQAPPKSATAVCAAAELFIPLGELVDLDKERQRLRKDQEQLAREIARGEGKLQNPGFLQKAPPALIEEERQKLETCRAMIESLNARAEELAGME
nr:valine--tRNA ligase [Clostridia bacterium]